MSRLHGLMKHQLSICLAPIILAAASVSALAQSADIQRIMRGQAASTRVGEVRHAGRHVIASVKRPAHRAALARHRPTKLKARPVRYASHRSATITQVASNVDTLLNEIPAMSAPETGTKPAVGPVAPAMSYSPAPARSIVSEAFDAIDGMEKERSLSAPKSTVQEPLASRGDVFQWVWSGLRQTWRSLSGHEAGAANR
jgi:hypothetical protein